VFLVGAVGLELTVRVIERARGNRYSSWETLSELRRTVRSMRDRVPLPDTDSVPGTSDTEGAKELLHPYAGWDTLDSFRQIEHELRYFAAGEDEEPFDVLIVGGSVAGGFGLLAGEALAEHLCADPRLSSREIRVLVYGRGAYKQPQQVMVVQYLLALGFRPDAVLCIDGFNEVALASANHEFGALPVYPSFPQWSPVARGGLTDLAALDHLFEVREWQVAAERLTFRTERFGLHYSAVAGRILRARMNALHRGWGEAQQRYLEFVSAEDADVVTQGPGFELDLDGAIAVAVRAWEESVRSLQAMCDARGIAFLAVLQPTLHDVGSKPLTEDEIERRGAARSWIEGVHRGYPLLRERGHALAAEGVGFADGSMVFAGVEETLYYDPCHFVASGHELLAELAAKALLSRLPPE
jgi:hypothetical protein